jgi:putative phosphoesterase
MKLGLVSDVHADPVALELAWAHLTVLGADRIVCAGDVVGYGPFRGGTPSAETLDFLAGLPPHLALEGDGKVVVVVHGSPRDDMEFVTRERHPTRVLRGWLEELRCDVLVVGHTHEPMACRTGRGLVVNPGSVVSASGVSTSRTFALLDLASLAVTFHDVETGDVVTPRPWSDDTVG